MSTARIAHLTSASLSLLLLASSPPAGADLVLGPEELVQAGGVDIDVPGYSVQSFVPWDGDTRLDLIVGEGGGGYPEGRVRAYLNVGTGAAPEFADYSYVQSEGVDLILPGSG
jgi:hypothetical protein